MVLWIQMSVKIIATVTSMLCKARRWEIALEICLLVQGESNVNLVLLIVNYLFINFMIIS
jgi:hypothetical protein